MRKLSFLGLLVVAPSLAQTFDVEQIDQLFRPRLRVDLHYQPESAFRDTTGFFSELDGSAAVTFPIHSRFDVSLGLDTNARSLGELVTNSVRIEASQLLGSFRFGARQVETGFDTVPTRQLYSASVGLMGMKLTKKKRVLFWSANVNVSEEDASLDGAVPRFNGTIGKMHVKGVRRTFFYGLGIAFSDKLTLPMPFIGGTAPLGGDWSFQYVLPAQLAVGFAPTKRTKFLSGISIDAFRSGAQWHADRANLNYGAVRAFLNVRYKAGDHFQVRADLGYAFTQTVRFSGTAVEPTRYPIVPGLSIGVGANVLFGAGIMERVIEEVVR
ncbi:MAG: hypothetical protein ABI432_00680 [Flavobacteriales bacterium]